MNRSNYRCVDYFADLGRMRCGCNDTPTCIYRHKPDTFSEANEMIDRYIHFYNHERIQLKTGEAPLTRRLSD